MTKKHFIAFAKIIKRMTASNDLFSHADALIIAETFADFAAQSNSRFDRARFMSACGL